MTKAVVSVEETASYRDVVDLLIERRCSAVPVVDRGHRVIGVISETDLLRKIEYAGDEEPRVFERRSRRGERAKASALTAAGLMSGPPVVALPGTSVAAAARRMDAEHVKRLPVVDDLGRLVGIVSRGDLLKTYLRPDDEIQADVESGVLRPFLVDDTASVLVSVKDGVVTLAGRVGRYSSAELVERLARQVAGVVAVSSGLTYDVDDREPVAPVPFF
ncbi:CBS-domain-containing membrane protein [Actinoplanes octamycinicus]|uniref:CBS-domain-containing membrane protein n=1 Tax=Actinoplanes octamycinicus TaxID=135948 RepID=A0A7W7H1X9_9ACTN|nr:CBS domain-containing protein [Actinoplanes octamycinicus]MBB4742495.1 CBS-domain-containing membrane protein [Actinoplanes octamycinicus]